MKKIGEVTACGYKLDVMLLQYATGSNCIYLVEPGCGPFATLSVNVPGVKLAANLVSVKTWGENEDLRTPMLRSGLFTDTGELLECGFEEAEIWRLSAAVMEAVGG